jgi:hypothetical protein
LPAASHPVDAGDIDVLAFSSAENAAAPPLAGDSVKTQSFALRIEIRPHPDLPPRLTWDSITAGERPRLHSRIAASGAPPNGPDAVMPPLVVGLYRKIGPLVLAKDVAGTSGPTPLSGKPLHSYTLVVLSNPKPGRERAYNDWYDHQHVADVLRVPGFQTAQRLKLLVNETPRAFTLPRYAVRFTFDSFDLEATIADIRHRLATGITRPGPDFDTETSVIRYYELAPPAP